ncbi:UvrD-helicase domain-containing protein [Nocardia sp. NPDC057440]|uniref:UvrD-helicase domain-containing protein n=1 Tax=Nocardia sp. NPDC057440 TaxID=3346134 RepID=UPI00366A5EFA
MGIRLENPQVLAAAADDPLVNILSAPGSGKTTVAAERFGYLHHKDPGGRRGVIGLSFNRTAVGELRSRIAARWGRPALVFPNLVTTFDDFHVRTMKHLLRLGLLKWPNGHHEVDVIDDYSSKSGYQWIAVKGWLRIASCKLDGTVWSDSVRAKRSTYGFGRAGDHRTVLEAGCISHDDVRHILNTVLGLNGAQDAIDDWMVKNYRHIIVDEIYDADELDLHVASRAATLGIGVTVVGDPWQALYDWRGATPAKVKSNLQDKHEFTNFHQPKSFRFKSEQMRELTDRLRHGKPVDLLPIASDAVDIALARRWAELWKVGDNILPLAFRSGFTSEIDAVLCLLLDIATGSGIGLPAFGRQNAVIRLGMTDEVLEDFRDVILRPALEELVGDVPADAVLERLRLRMEGAGRRRPRRAADESVRHGELDLLRARLKRRDLIPGLTVHQAKGREWDRVGVALNSEQERMLNEGLRELEPEHCVLYVALTRAKYTCGSLRSPHELDLTGATS